MHFGKIFAALCVAGGIAVLLSLKNNSAPAQKTFSAENATGEVIEKVSPANPSTLTDTSNEESFLNPKDSDSDEEILDLARTAVSRSFQRALAWAESQSDEALRERFLFAVVRAWGEKDPRGAVDWAIRQDEDQRFVRMEAVLTGAAAQPDVALQIGRELLAENPDTGSAYGTALVGALSASGKFEAALQFANESPAESRAIELANIFQRWSADNPANAIKALGSIDSGVLRDSAINAIATGWPSEKAASLAEFALSLPQGESRAFTLNTAFEKWCLQDSVAFAEWLNRVEASPAIDSAIATLVTRTDSLQRSPDIALGWVETITDKNLRLSSVTHVLKEWMTTDPAAAKNYVEQAAWLQPSERNQIIRALAAPATSVTAGFWSLNR